MNRKIAKILSALLFAAALAVTQIPVSDVEAIEPASDFQMEGSKLLKYTGTAEVVSVPDTVKEIGEEAFAGNDNLVKVTIGGNVEKVDYRAFADCDNLRTIKVGDSVTELATAAFSNNNALKNVSIGNSLKKVGSGVFAGCSQLSELSVSEDNPYLYYSDGVLYDAEKKILYALMPNYEKQSLTLPESVEEINAYACWGNPYLEYVAIDSSLSSVPSFAFSNCINLKNVDIPLPVRSIEAKAFEDCVNLALVTLPDSMNMIHDTAFDGCTNVEFNTTPGTYASEFAVAFKTSEADNIEYEDVENSQVISLDEITETVTSISEPSPTPEAAIETETETEKETELPVSPTTIEGSSSGRLLGESSIVAGRAVVFIDNSQANVSTGNINVSKVDLSIDKSSNNTQSDAASETENSTKIGDILSDNAQKGKDFPKYTVVGNKVASQAYYQNTSLTEYEIEEGITELGDFAFARSALTAITIPEGVEKIGYGAFYHCDNLTGVTIPLSVKEIEANAFSQTPWLSSMLNNSSSPFVIIGDGILLAYSGSDSVVNIPDGVKQIGAEAFKDHMGITAVNMPDSVTVIGEAAFSGCKNLKTVNGGRAIKKVCDRAFQDCPLSQIVIPSTMEEIGLGAFDCSGGTDTVIFEGEVLPALIMGENSGRLSNAEGRTYAFDQCKTAIVSGTVSNLEGTVLEKGSFGFHGRVYDNDGNLLADLSQGAEVVSSEGIALQINSNVIVSNNGNIMADMPGNTDSYVLKISDSEAASEKIASAYGELYGGRQPSGLMGLDISLYDSTGQIPITKLGRQYITVQIPKPAGIGEGDLHLVTLDSDGQLEAVEYQLLDLEDGSYIQFTARHFSPYGLYSYSGYDGQGVVNGGNAVINLSGNKDDTPDTGDFIHPKWILALGLLAASIALFFFKGISKGKNFSGGDRKIE
ncbi:MAG: leucine-rich repeat domain-containing protein [Suilimivivens sp.]